MFEQKSIQLVTETIQPDSIPTPAPNSLKKILFSFSGRIGRITYIKYIILYVVLSCVLLAVFNLAASYLDSSAVFGTFSLIVALSLFWAAVALLAKRNHDINFSSLWLILLLIPVIGLIHPIYLCFAPGTKGDNKFGASP